MSQSHASDPVALAQAESATAVTLVATAAETQTLIRELVTQLAAAEARYATEYKAVLDTWGTAKTSKFGLLAPDKVTAAPPPGKTRRAPKRPRGTTPPAAADRVTSAATRTQPPPHPREDSARSAGGRPSPVLT